MITVIYNYIETKQASTYERNRKINANLEEVNFYQLEPAQVKVKDGKLHVSITYYNCNKKGYYKSYYLCKENNDSNEEKKEEGVSKFQVDNETFISSKSDNNSFYNEVGALFY